MSRLAPVCSNCGGTEFVWANDLKTGGLGGGSLSLRSRGELSLGTRICRSCGHADLFLKDPTILRMPHTWRPGEFTPITPRPVAPAHHPVAVPPSPTPAPAAPAPPPAAPPAPPPQQPPPPPPVTPAPPDSPAEPVAAPPAPSEPTPAPVAAPAEAPPETEAAPAQGGKRPTRRRSKGKSKSSS